MPEKDKISFTVILGHLITIMSLLFVAVYLISIDDFSLATEILLNRFMFFSLAMLCAGFIFAAVNWKFILFINGHDITISQAAYTVGMSVFAKYIPGKIWSTLGRANLVVRFGIPIQEAVLISIHLQIMFIAIGLILGITGMWLAGQFAASRLGIYIFIVTPAFFMLLPKVRMFLFRCIGKLIKKEISPIPIKTTSFLSLTGLIFAQWCCWGLGFYCMSRAVIGAPIPLLPITFAFPLSVTIGILSIVSPGGIGVREGVIVAALQMMNLELTDSINISLVGRIWFIGGELFILIMALLAAKKRKLKE